MRRDLVPLLFVVAATVAAAYAARPMATYRALALGASPFEIGIVQSAFSAFPVLFAVGLGRWIDRIGGPTILSLGCVAMILGGALAATSGSLGILGLSQLAMGLGMVSTAVASQALIANDGPPDGRVDRFGWYGGVTALGQMLGHGRHCDPSESTCDLAFLPDEGGLTHWGCPSCTPGQGALHILGCELLGWSVPVGGRSEAPL